MNEHEYRAMYHLEEDHWWYAGMRAISAALLETTTLPGAPRVLDAGCGTGFNLGWLRRRGAAVAGVDFYADALEWSRLRGERALARASVVDLPFASGVFDLVTSFDVVSHVRDGADRRRSLAEFRRVLRPGGVVLLRVAAFEWLRTSHDNEILTHHRFGPRELRLSLAAAGFESIRLTFANMLLFPAAIAWRLLKRARLAPRGSDVSPVTRGPDWLNRALRSLLELEAAFLRARHTRLPLGLSLMAVARKPLDGEIGTQPRRSERGILHA